MAAIFTLSTSANSLFKVAPLATVAVALLLLIQGAAAATNHTVGGDRWTVPTNMNHYSQWASSQTFAVGDSLFFNFPTDFHDVVRVPKSSYDACTTNGMIGPIITTGPATVSLTAAGMHYYLCSVGNHCSQGQKLAIQVMEAGAAGAPGSVPSPSMSPGGDNNSVASLAPLSPAVVAVVGLVASSFLV